MGSENLTFDLFGELRSLPGGGRGRPAHCWSQENENLVILGLAMGKSNAEIANGLGVSEPTLRKYYFSALKRRDMQRDRFELWRAAKLAEMADAGNVSALDKLGKLIEKHDRLRAQREIEASKAGPTLGKKEKQIAAAREVISDDDLLTPGFGGRVN